MKANPAKTIGKNQGVLVRNQFEDEKGRALGSKRTDIVLVSLPKLREVLKYFRANAYPDYAQLATALLGFIRVEELPRCRTPAGGTVWAVRAVVAEEGWGPALYDMALEVARARRASLAPDRSTVTASAEKIWRHYADRRDSVDSVPLKGWLCTHYRSPVLDAAYSPGTGFPGKLDAAQERLGALLDSLPQRDEQGLQEDLNLAGWNLFDSTYSGEVGKTSRRYATSRPLAVLAATAGLVLGMVAAAPLVGNPGVAKLKRRLL